MISFYGLMQPFADALKLFLKEVVLPYTSNRNLFLGAPILTLTLAFIGKGKPWPSLNSTICWNVLITILPTVKIYSFIQ